MASKLDALLEQIDPARTLDKVSAEVDRAVNSFTRGPASIDSWDDYTNHLAGFCKHVEKEVLKIRAAIAGGTEFYWSRCVNILNNEFGPNGFKTAFEMVKTGKNGGLYGVLKIIAQQMAEMYTQNEISGRVNTYWASLTVDQQVAATDEYLQKYGHLLPPEFTEGTAARLKFHFPKVLTEHPKIIQRMRRVGR